ncbi:MAG: hypothetical protein ACM3NJ_00645 [Methanobacterium sp.]
MNITELKTWAIEKNIDQKTKTLFIKMIENYMEEYTEEYCECFGNIPINDLYLDVHTVSLNLGNWPECNYNTISASMRIQYMSKDIANYKVMFTLDGEPEDDFFDVF